MLLAKFNFTNLLEIDKMLPLPIRQIDLFSNENPDIFDWFSHLWINAINSSCFRGAHRTNGLLLPFNVISRVLLLYVLKPFHITVEPPLLNEDLGTMRTHLVVIRFLVNLQGKKTKDYKGLGPAIIAFFNLKYIVIASFVSLEIKKELSNMTIS